MTENKQKEQLKKYKPQPGNTAAIMSFLCIIAAGVCWFLRDFEFRHAVKGGEMGEKWVMADLNIALRRGLLIFTVIALFAGFRAVSARGKFIDFLAFSLSVLIALAVGYAVWQMGGRGFWLGT